MDLALLAVAALTAVDVDAQRLLLELDPATGSAQIQSFLTVEGDGSLLVRLNGQVSVDVITVATRDGRPEPTDVERRPDPTRPGMDILEIEVPPGTTRVHVASRAQFREDIAGSPPRRDRITA